MITFHTIPKISRMSLLGTVEGCSGETVRLLLDIDRGRPAQLSYPWTWVPAAGNLMYLMPQVGTRVSLYFKGEEETDAITVNCIRSGDGCAEEDYRDKSLTTEHGMQLRLNQGDMGIVSLKEKLLLDVWRVFGLQEADHFISLPPVRSRSRGARFVLRERAE